MKKEYPIRYKEPITTVLSPDICECSHGSEHHGGVLTKNKCHICECPLYVQDVDLIGWYINYNYVSYNYDLNLELKYSHIPPGFKLITKVTTVDKK